MAEPIKINEEVKEVLSNAFSEFRKAYRSDETEETMIFPRDKYPDLASYQAAKIMETFVIVKRMD